MGSALYCKVCAGSLRTVGRCVNGCCTACHLRYCSPIDHTLDVEKARAQQAADLLAALPSRRVRVTREAEPS